MEDLKFGVYARKSSTGEDRQVLSIDSQVSEMDKLAQKEKEKVIKEFTDSQTAHKPYMRPQGCSVLK